MTLFPLTTSKRLITALKLVHGLALCASFSNALPIMVQVLLAIVLMAHYRWVLARCQPSGQTLRYSKALGWEIAHTQDWMAVRILPDTVITTFALFLHIEIQDSHTHISHSSMFGRIKPHNRQTLLIAPDSFLSPGTYRILVVKLKTSYKIKSKSSNLLVKSG
ncbi:MAG: hypothetical protein PHU14_13185 [Methylovulum sp.]|nr:hypothetical protein [Methylovulum sp.]